jgi:translation initiation factor IF-1
MGEGGFPKQRARAWPLRIEAFAFFMHR